MDDLNDPKPARTDKDILEEARDRLRKCIDDYATERTKQKDDLLFSTLDQWPASIRSDREEDPNGARPCLTIDQINQYIVQVVNDLRQNRPSIKVRPVDDGADVETAEIFQGIIRHIEDQSIAQIAYMTAGESAVRVGEGYFRFVTEYENEKSSNQVIRVKRCPDMFAVYLGPHMMPTGEDAEYGFIFEDIPEQRFRRLFPKAKYHQTDFSELDGYTDYWLTDKRIRVAEYFYFEYTPKTLLTLNDGSFVLADEYDGPEENIQDKRETRLKTTKWCKLTGLEILEKRDWAGKYIPIVKVTGKEAWVDGKRVIWGLVRPAKDSLRMYNYVASTIVEKFALQPKTPFIGAKGQFEGLEDRWQNANRYNYSYLEYNPISADGLSVPPPQRQQPAPIEAALYQFLATCREDVQASLGMFKASLGKEQPNQSGKAILALTRESDTGTFHFSDNLSLSIQYGGRILIDLSPKVMDTKQVLRVLGEDGKLNTAEINPDQEVAKKQTTNLQGEVKTIYNLGVGTYDVTATVGPSYNTKRMEASALFSDLATNAKDPHLALVANYFAVKNADFQGSEKAAEMLEKLMPPGLAPAPDGQPNIPPQVAQKMQQMGQALQQLSQENQQLKSGLEEAKIKTQGKLQADTLDINATHAQKMKEQELNRAVEIEAAKTAQYKAESEVRIKGWVAEQEVAIDKFKAGITAKLDISQHVHDSHLAQQQHVDAHALETKKHEDAHALDQKVQKDDHALAMKQAENQPTPSATS